MEQFREHLFKLIQITFKKIKENNLQMYCITIFKSMNLSLKCECYLYNFSVKRFKEDSNVIIIKK